jgi:hypothetical protein
MLAFVIIGFGILLPAAHGDEWNERTKVTFAERVQVPGHILPAGTYWFVLANSDSNREIVQIFGADKTTLYATILTASTDRLRSADETTFTLAERPSNQPAALVRWFYPGELIGHEFVYSGHEQKELAQDKQDTIVAGSRANGL